ncbi:FAD-dependent oxidoreductase [archaeon]|jgi:thioredoxin reductase (NADPH)|nr:FAD-dependent oxidoreductase [archaeon]
MTSSKKYDLAIVGGGIVGYSAAMYAARMGIKTILFEGVGGGELVKTDMVENYPGFDKISGYELVKKVMDHAKNYDVEIVSGMVDKVSKKKECFSLVSDKKTFSSRTILFATGAKYKLLGVPGEKEFTTRGVHNCALCDGPFYKNKIAAVVGGGDSAVKEALVLSRFVKKVYMIVRSKLRPEPINLEKLKKDKKIQVLLKTQVKGIQGDKKVESLLLDKKFKGSDVLKLDAVFVAIGHDPISDLAASVGVIRNKKKEIKMSKDSETNVKGAFAAGDVGDTKFKQAITGVGEAVKAVYSIYEYLGNQKIQCS